MVRLADLTPAQAKRYGEVECPRFETTPFVKGPSLERRRVALVTSAGLINQGEPPFRGGDAGYRTIAASASPDRLLMSHISVNFDRTGFQEDCNVVFPLDRLRELVRAGRIGSVADTHYSFMGATDPMLMRPFAQEVAERLKQDRVDAVLLSPV